MELETKIEKWGGEQDTHRSSIHDQNKGLYKLKKQRDKSRERETTCPGRREEEERTKNGNKEEAKPELSLQQLQEEVAKLLKEVAGTRALDSSREGSEGQGEERGHPQGNQGHIECKQSET